MNYLVTLVLGWDPHVEVVSVGVFRWKWWAQVRGLLAKYLGPGANRLVTFVVWDIPTKWPGRMHSVRKDDGDIPKAWLGVHTLLECKNCETRWSWDGSFAPKWLWSKKPCVWCSTEAMRQGFHPPPKPLYTLTSARLVIDPDVPGIVEEKAVRSLMTPELTQTLHHALLTLKFTLEQVRDVVSTEGFQKAAWLELQKRGLVPMWKPPCSTCGGNCGQCGSSHCSICGQKNQFPHMKTCDPLMHAAYEATKCERCGDYAQHLCLDGKTLGDQYSAKKRYVWQEPDVLGQVVNR